MSKQNIQTSLHLVMENPQAGASVSLSLVLPGKLDTADLDTVFYSLKRMCFTLAGTSENSIDDLEVIDAQFRRIIVDDRAETAHTWEKC